MKELLKGEKVWIVLHKAIHVPNMGVAHPLNQMRVIHKKVQVLAN